MFIYLFILLLVFYKIEFTQIFVYFYIIYLLVYSYNNTFYIFSKKNHLTNLDVVSIYFKKLSLFSQIFFLNIKNKPLWKPLFRKMSYFGFYRNSINNTNKK